MKFLSNQCWGEIRRAAKRSKTACVAVAYLGTGASQLLPLPAASMLVVDATERTIKAGMTNPHELLKYVKRGVNVYTCKDLHAKVFVFDSQAFIGSFNVSNHSANDLHEAGIEVLQAKALSEARDFVHSLCGDQLTPAYLKTLQKIYRPPSWEGHIPSRGAKSRPQQILHSNLWIVPLEYGEVTDASNVAWATSVDEANRRLNSSSRYVRDDFRWRGGPMMTQLRRGHRVVCVVQNPHGGRVLSAPARVLMIRRYVDFGRPWIVVHIEMDNDAQDIPLRNAIAKLGGYSHSFRSLGSTVRRVRSAPARVAIGRMWNPSAD